MCILGQAHFPFSPDRPTLASSRPATPQWPICARPPSPIPTRCTSRLHRAWVGAPARPLFSSMRRRDQPPPAPCRLASSPGRTTLPSNPACAALKWGCCITATPFPLFLFLARCGHPSAYPSFPPVRVPPSKCATASELELRHH
jgi:hypothetical protein